uniref:Uncharacterized protein n=1 Tax=Anopheles merus TaxID=30066 RepID=A0A182VNE4_ANOME
MSCVTPVTGMNLLARPPGAVGEEEEELEVAAEVLLGVLVEVVVRVLVEVLPGEHQQQRAKVGPEAREEKGVPQVVVKEEVVVVVVVKVLEVLVVLLLTEVLASVTQIAAVAVVVLRPAIDTNQDTIAICSKRQRRRV